MTYRDAMQRAAREYWLAMLERYRWNYVHTARAAGVCRQHIYGILSRVGISRPSQQSH